MSDTKSKVIALPHIEKVYWEDIRGEFEQVNSELCHIIDQISPAKDLFLFKVRYRFGDEIIKKGRLHLPCNGELLPIDDNKISSEIRNLLDYNLGTNPVSMLLKNSAEIFMQIEQRTIPLYGLITAGKIFSTSRILSHGVSYSPPFLWDMTAGARSIFMLPKIADKVGQERINRELNLQVLPPTQILDHWNVFRAIANNENTKNPWFMETLFFTKKWFEHIDDEKWKDFRFYLLQVAWDGSEFWRNQFVWDLVFSIVQKNSNLRPNPYIADTTKHLLAMGVGAVPGFAPAINDMAGPCEQLQQVYTDLYCIKDYQPIIMHTHSLDIYRATRPIYYSLEYPSTMEFSPKSKKVSNKITDLREIKHLLDKYNAEIKKGFLNVHGTPFQELFDKAQYDYFHANVGYEGIRSSEEMPQDDECLKPIVGANGKLFPLNSSFVRGCVRITSK